MVTGFSPLRAAACALGIAVLSMPAAAQMRSSTSSEGLYVFGAMGANFPEDSEIEGPGFNLDAEFSKGWTAGGGLGYAYGNGFRTEFELTLRDSDFDSIAGAEAGGDLESQAMMFNLLYDFDLGWPVKPFVGAGLGGARVNAEGVSAVSGSTIDEADYAFAWQATAGVAYAVNRNLDFTLAYRYFSVPDLDYTTAAGADVETDYNAHEVLLGVVFRFGGPAPAPEPVPAVQPQAQPAPPPQPEPQVEPVPPPVPREYLVFFDWNSAEITPQARDVLRTAVDNARKVGVTRIRLTGHADRSGPTSYNQGLSIRRGEAVRAELERLGLSDSEIAVVGRGESEPLVPTDDGVREPRNRRVEIVLQ